MMAEEVVRRAHERNITKKFPRPKNWKTDQLVSYLKSNPVITESDILYLRQQQNAFFQACTNSNKEKAQQSVVEEKQGTYRWGDDPNRYYRMIIAAQDDNVRKAMADDGKCKDRQRVDGRNSDKMPDGFYKALTDKWNDEEFVAKTPALPNLHEDFTIEHEIYHMDVPNPVSIEFITKRWKDCKMRLNRLANRYEGSGHGFGQIDGREVFGHMTEEALQADDRKDYLWHHFGERPHLLLL
ncbi:hypothetical protein SEMRO_71_G039390.1 [Seminavis robusta]|uniref:Uncharacterized protein n=1 Tax=Seminavis robusta TaxID=568900 RepID=A0A9N8DG29_9STRA|nr:hypothetical protein SEMRO_71_G039390.1 [Seminavis robusta]|eukprot:Sro71_g039390.1 n/a (240) ;mRNA; f:66303-67022